MGVVVVSGALALVLDQATKRAVATGRWGLRAVAHRKGLYARRGGRVAMLLLWLAAFASALALTSSGAWFQSGAARVGLGLALGGAAGNLIDVLRRRYVVDFIDLRVWPVFNLADVGIVGGLILAFWSPA